MKIISITKLSIIFIALGLCVAFTIPAQAQQQVWCHSLGFNVEHETGYAIQNRGVVYKTTESRCSESNTITKEIAVKNAGAVVKQIITTNFLHPIFDLLISGKTEELSNLLTHIDKQSNQIVRDYIQRREDLGSYVYIPLLTDEIIYKFDGALGLETIEQHHEAVRLSGNCEDYDYHITSIVEGGESDCPDPSVELEVDVITREDGTPRPLSEDEGTFRGSATTYTFTLRDDFNGASNLSYEVSAENSCQTERRATATAITENQATEIETRGGVNVCFWVETENGITNSVSWEIPVVEVEEEPEDVEIEEETPAEDGEEDTADGDTEPITL